MSEARTARIIQFPPPAPAAGSPPRQGPGRPVEALVALGEALAAQRDAVARWRHALADLRGAVRDLGESARTYRDGLDALATRVASSCPDAAAPAHGAARAGAGARSGDRSVPCGA